MQIKTKFVFVVQFNAVRLSWSKAYTYSYFFLMEYIGIILQDRNLAVCSKFSSVQSLSRVWLFATPWTAAHQASLSIINSRSLLRLMSIESAMPSNHLILCRPLLQSFPASGSFQMSQLFISGGQSIGVSASASLLPVNTQDWSPLGWTGWISFQSKGLKSLLQHHSSKASVSSSVLSFLYSPTLTSIHNYVCCKNLYNV